MASHYCFFDGKDSRGNSPVYSIKVNAHGAQIHDTTGPSAGSTATPPEQVPDSILFQMLFYFLMGPLSSTIVQNKAQVCRKLCYSIQRVSRNWISEDRTLPTASGKTGASRRRAIHLVGRISLTPGRSYGIMGYRTLCRPFWSKFQSRKGPTLCLIRRQCPS